MPKFHRGCWHDQKLLPALLRLPSQCTWPFSFQRASSAVSSRGTASATKYSFCCVSDHSTESALRFPTGLSAVYSSLFYSLRPLIAPMQCWNPSAIMTICQQVSWPLNTPSLHPERLCFSRVLFSEFFEVYNFNVKSLLHKMNVENSSSSKNEFKIKVKLCFDSLNAINACNILCYTELVILLKR